MKQPIQKRMLQGRRGGTLVIWLGLVGGLLLGGCRLAHDTVNAPVKMVTAVVPGTKAAQTDPAVLQMELQRYADEYASRTAAALDEYAAHEQTPAAQRQALKWKGAVGFATVGIASGPNPRANLLDFIAIATITRNVLEKAVTTTNGAPFQSWLRVSRSLETNVWELAAGIFTPKQQQELREVIQRWWEANPDVQNGFFARPQEFSALVRKSHPPAAGSESVFNLVGLDPMVGLDPAVREVTSTRLFAERAMFMAQRMPFLLRWQTELLTEDLLQQEKIANALDSADRLSRAAESVSQTAAQLPDRIATERQAVLEAMQAQEGKLRELSAEVGRTLAAGEKMSDSLNTTLVTFDALMKRFGVGEPSAAPPDTNSPPFNILDYAQTAGQVTAMAQQLDLVIKDLGSTLDSPALDRRIAEVAALSKVARNDAKSVLNHAFLLAAGLVALIFGGVWLARRPASRISTTTRS